MKTQAFRAATVLLLLGSLAGCGQLGLSSAIPGTDSPDMQALRTGDGRWKGHDGHGDRAIGSHAFGFDWLKGLDLSTEQRTQLQAIAESFRPETPGHAPSEPPFVRIGDLLKAEPLDVEALRTALSDAALMPPTPSKHPVEALVAARGVLTDAQRAEVVTRLKETALPEADPDRPQPPTPGERLDAIAATLDLDASQTAALEAFKGKLSTPVKPDPAAHRDAMIALFETGDATALEALFQSRLASAAFPIEEFVALAQVLTPDQRKVLLVPERHARHFGAPRHRDRHSSFR